MTAQQRLTPNPSTDPESPVERVAQLRAALEIVERLAGDGAAAELPLVSDADVERAWREAPGVARRRFHAIAAETVSFSTVGIRALIGREAGSGAAAEVLADEMRRSLTRMAQALGA